MFSLISAGFCFNGPESGSWFNYLSVAILAYISLNNNLSFVAATAENNTCVWWSLKKAEGIKYVDCWCITWVCWSVSTNWVKSIYLRPADKTGISIDYLAVAPDTAGFHGFRRDLSVWIFLVICCKKLHISCKSSVLRYMFSVQICQKPKSLFLLFIDHTTELLSMLT